MLVFPPAPLLKQGLASGHAQSLMTPREASHADAKRRYRKLQRLLVSTLDRSLPDRARSMYGFKGAGPRSTGLCGRSSLNVLSDCVKFLKQTHLEAAGELAARRERGALEAPRCHPAQKDTQAPRQVANEEKGQETGTEQAQVQSGFLPVTRTQAVPKSQIQEALATKSHVQAANDLKPGGVELWKRSMSPLGTCTWQRIETDSAVAWDSPRMLHPDLPDCMLHPDLPDSGSDTTTRVPSSLGGNQGDCNQASKNLRCIKLLRALGQPLARGTASSREDAFMTERATLGMQCLAEIRQPSLQGLFPKLPLPVRPNEPLDVYAQGVVSRAALGGVCSSVESLPLGGGNLGQTGARAFLWAKPEHVAWKFS